MFTFALSLLVLVAPAGDPPKQPADAERFQGEWELFVITADGDKNVVDRTPIYRLIFRDGKYEAISLGNNNDEKGTFTLSPDQKPKQFDLKITDGKDKGKSQHGIYEFDGDSIRMSLGNVGEPRPSSFDPRESNFVAVLRKKKG